MKGERKKLIVFGVIITFFTALYTAFLNTVTKAGLSDDHFFVNWMRLVPKTYFPMLPFVLVAGSITSALVKRIFRNEKGAS
jgi:hypothetical protein